MRPHVSLLGVLFLAAAAAAESQDLATFMKAADEAAAPAASARADGTIVSDTLEGKKEDRIVLVVRPNKDVYIEMRQSGRRALLKGDGSGGQIAEKGAAPADFPPSQPFGSTDFTGEDLTPFRAAHYNSATIVYRDANQLAVQLNPLKSQYSLTLITFDPSKKVPVKTLYYKDTLNNLLKMRLDGDHQQLGERWFPGKVSMETFALKTKTTLDLKWSAAAADAEKVFEAGALAKPSTITWPAQ